MDLSDYLLFSIKGGFKICDTKKVTVHFKEKDIFDQNTYLVVYEVFIPGEDSINLEVTDRKLGKNLNNCNNFYDIYFKRVTIKS